MLREGDLLSELNKEVKHGEFDIAIMGSPRRKRMTNKISQFLDTSIFFVKNFNFPEHWTNALGSSFCNNFLNL